MEYFEQNIDAIGNEAKANRTHKQISDLFKCRFPEGRSKKRLFRKKCALFCSKDGIEKMDEAEIDVIVQDCVCQVSPAAGRFSPFFSKLSDVASLYIF